MDARTTRAWLRVAAAVGAILLLLVINAVAGDAIAASAPWLAWTFAAVFLLASVFATWYAVRDIRNPLLRVNALGATAAAHVLVSSMAYVVWGSIDRCARRDATAAVCGGGAACSRQVPAIALPATVVAAEIATLAFVLVGAWAAGVAAAAAGVSSKISVLPALKYCGAVIVARFVFEALKLLLDYDEVIIQSVRDPALRDTLAACVAEAQTQPPAAGSPSPPTPTAGTPSPVTVCATDDPNVLAQPVDLLRRTTIPLLLLRIGTRRALLETVGGVTAAVTVNALFRFIMAVARP
jgi:hypothetical protein